MSKFLATSGTRKYIKLENEAFSIHNQGFQITRTLNIQKSITGGRDLKNWSQSARKELGGAGGAALLVSKNGKDNPWQYEAPKLAMIAASPVIAEYFQKNPEAREFKCLGPLFKPKAIERIAHWLRVVVSTRQLGDLRLVGLGPKLNVTDLKNALDVRVAMQLLNMSQYIDQLAEKYKNTLEYPQDSAMDPTKTPIVFRTPSTAEARLVLRYADTDNNHDLVDALAYHMVVVRKKNGLDVKWMAFLTDPVNYKMAHAMKAADGVFATKVKELRKSRDEDKKRRRSLSNTVDKVTRTRIVEMSMAKKNPASTTSSLPRGQAYNVFELLRDDGDQDDKEGEGNGWILVSKK